MNNISLVPTLLSAFALTILQPSSVAAIKGGTAMEVEWREVDALLAKVDSVELGKLSPRVLRLAEWLQKEKGDSVAQRYFEKGLEGNSWALPQQLMLGELLARQGQPEALREKAEMVLRIGEEDGVLRHATQLLGRPLPAEPPPFSTLKGPEPMLVLTPVGRLSLFTLHDLRAALAKRLPLKVEIASVKVELPAAKRDVKAYWMSTTRERLLAVMRAQPAVRAQWEEMGFTEKRIRNSDAALVGLVRKVTREEQGKKGEEALDAMLAQIEGAKQWSDEQMIGTLEPALGDRLWSGLMVLGVTPHDLYGGTSNFLFGVGATGRYLGVISQHRFRAEFNGEPPKRERLVDRLMKQSLSTIGFMLGVPRCTTPECARAYPRSLAEHDLKPATLCPVCRGGFEKALGKKMPEG
jgi:predicted Zn-dependent protease